MSVESVSVLCIIKAFKDFLAATDVSRLPAPPLPSPNRRLIYIVVASILTFLLTGVVFGWAPLQLSLIAEGVFAESCASPSNTTSSSCTSQQEALSSLYSVTSSIFSVVVWPAGIVLDHFGPLLCGSFGAVLTSIGLAIVGFLASASSPTLFYPGFLLLAIGGPFLMFSFFTFSNIFPSYKSTIVTLLNVMLDSSSMVFAIVHVVANGAGWRVEDIFKGYMVVPMLAFVFQRYVWPKAPFKSDVDHGHSEGDTNVTANNVVNGEKSEIVNEEEKHKEEGEEVEKAEVDILSLTSASTLPPPANHTDVPPSTSIPIESSLSSSEVTANDVSQVIDENVSKLIEMEDQMDFPIGGDVVQSVPSFLSFHGSLRTLHQSPFFDCLRSPFFYCFLPFACLHPFRINFFIGTVDDQLLFMTNNNPSQASLYSLVFSWILPVGGVLCIPLIGYFLDRKGVRFSLYVLNSVGVLMGVFNCIPNVNVQIVTFILVAWFRAFYYSAAAAYSILVFGFANFGKVWGFVCCLAGIVNFLIGPVSDAVLQYLGGNFFVPNLIITLLTIAAFYFPVWFGRMSRGHM